MEQTQGRPKWLRDFKSLLGVRSQFILHGNIRDVFLWSQKERAENLTQTLLQVLSEVGFEGLFKWDPVTEQVSVSFRHHGESPNEDTLKTHAGSKQSPRTVHIGKLADTIENLTRLKVDDDGAARIPVAFVIDLASRLEAAIGEDDQMKFFAAMERLSVTAERCFRGKGQALLFNPVIWLVHRANDIPFWMTSDNERVKELAVPLPDADTRLAFARQQYAELALKEGSGVGEFAERLSTETHGLTLNALADIVSIANTSRKKAGDIDEAIDSYRLGDIVASDDPWQGGQITKNLRDGEYFIGSTIRGQNEAISAVLDILKRSAVGMTGAHIPGSRSRPKGVLFFAGPSGVGKTMMAKKIAKLVFGNSEAYCRFDMSEFRGEHSGDRLIGAPPGYIGHDQGGELTNAIREQPFRVLLFDEIEKADGKILDKFLQILEDGRLTDGRGQTVYFSKSLIIFTSNAGIMDHTEKPAKRKVKRSHQEEDPIEYRSMVQKGVEGYFEGELGRPELHNRIGDNVVVFNYITPEVAAQILEDMLSIVEKHAMEAQKITVEFSESARAALKAEVECDKWLDDGGRGVGNLVEAMVVNPLSRFMFDNDVAKKSKIVVNNLFAAGAEGVSGDSEKYEIDAQVEN